MNEEKAVREWLETLPDGYRERALRNYDPNYHDWSSVNSLSYAISVAFDWEDTPEGYDFWSAVEYWATPTANLPPLPEEEMQDVDALSEDLKEQSGGSVIRRGG